MSTQVRLRDEMRHLLEIDEPMAAAGAELSGLHIKSETEEASERAELDLRALPKNDRLVGGGALTWNERIQGLRSQNFRRALSL